MSLCKRCVRRTFAQLHPQRAVGPRGPHQPITTLQPTTLLFGGKQANAMPDLSRSPPLTSPLQPPTVHSHHGHCPLPTVATATVVVHHHHVSCCHDDAPHCQSRSHRKQEPSAHGVGEGQKQIKAAAFDVFEEEPFKNKELISMLNYKNDAVVRKAKSQCLKKLIELFKQNPELQKQLKLG